MLTHEQERELRDEYEQEIHEKWLEHTRDGVLDDRVFALKGALDDLNRAMHRLMHSDDLVRVKAQFDSLEHVALHLAKRRIVERIESRSNG